MKPYAAKLFLQLYRFQLQISLQKLLVGISLPMKALYFCFRPFVMNAFGISATVTKCIAFQQSQ